MHFLTFLATAWVYVQVAAALGLPSNIPWVNAILNGNGQTPFSVSQHVTPNRIAIIGAGAGGSSAAFWLGKAKERWGLDIEVDIFDNNSYIGGRSTTVQPYDDPSLEPIELGASIFVKANKNLWRASDEFGLKRADFDDGDDSMGIWDGSNFVLQTAGGSWWDTVKVIWRYGIRAPSKTKTIVGDMIKQFVMLYTPESGKTPFHNLTSLATDYKWEEIVAQSTVDFFDSKGIDRRWTREMVEAATRVNYGQNVDEIHGLEGTVSLAATGASQVVGGNWQIFEQFVKRSGANVHLNTTVTTISQLNEDKYSITTCTDDLVTERYYRAVIIAAPFHSSSIDLSLTSTAPAIPPQPYVHLHVTLLTTPNPRPRTRYFGVKPNAKIPSTILTTWEGVRAKGESNAPEFNSLSYHGLIKNKDGTPANTSVDGTEEWSVKIFSKQKLEDRWLRRVFGKIGWVYRKEWDAYPLLPPTTTFPSIKLAKGLYYVNSFEPLISTMETETISARNVVELLLNEEFDASICKHTNSEETSTEEGDSDFVYGWDC